MISPNKNKSDKEYFNLGLKSIKNNQFDQAIEYFTNAIQLKPEFAEAYFGRGAAYFFKHDYDRAIEDCSKAIQLKLNFSEAYLGRGQAYLFKKDYDRAIEDCSKAIQLKPNFPEAYFVRGQAYLFKDDYDRAIEDYSKAIQIKPGFAEAYFRRGQAYLFKNDYDRAIEDCSKAIQLKPDFANAYFVRGEAYLFKKDYDRAIEDCSKAIQIKPDLAEAYFVRGAAYIFKDDYDRAIEDYSKAIQIKPDFAIAHLVRGQTCYFRAVEYYQLGAIELSADYLAKAEEGGIQRDFNVHLLKAQVALARGKNQEAIENLVEAKRYATPGDLIILNLWTIYARYLTAKQKAQAELWARAKKLLKLGDHPDYQNELNQLITELNRLKGAKDEKEEIEITLLFWLGVFYYELNDFANAINYLEKTIENAEKAVRGEKNYKKEKRKEMEERIILPAKHLLRHIWNDHYRPAWWRWWFCAPKPLHRCGKIVVGTVLIIFIARALIMPYIDIEFLHNKIPFLRWLVLPAPHYYITIIAVLLLVLFSPVLTRFRAQGFEVELTPPTAPEMAITPAVIEQILEGKIHS